MFKVKITPSVYSAIANTVSESLKKNKDSKMYRDVIELFYVQLLNISETLKSNPYSYPELITGYRFIMNYPIKLVYTIKGTIIIVFDGINSERRNDDYQKYLKGKNA